MVALEACADGDTLDQTLECAWLCPPSFALPASPLPFSLLLQTILRRERREERPSRGGGDRDNKGFKTLRAAYSKAAFQAARSQAASTEPSVPATSAMTEGWQNNHLNNMAESLTPQ